jgi:hypothetical protein
LRQHARGEPAAALGYKQLLRVEQCWRQMKSGLRMRPVFHYRPWRIQAHVTISVLALLLERVAEIRAGDTWRNIVARLERVQVVECDRDEARIRQTTEVRPAVDALLKSSASRRLPSCTPSRLCPPPTPSRPATPSNTRSAPKCESSPRHYWGMCAFSASSFFKVGPCLRSGLPDVGSQERPENRPDRRANSRQGDRPDGRTDGSRSAQARCHRNPSTDCGGPLLRPREAPDGLRLILGHVRRDLVHPAGRREHLSHALQFGLAHQEEHRRHAQRLGEIGHGGELDVTLAAFYLHDRRSRHARLARELLLSPVLPLGSPGAVTCTSLG